MKIKFELRSDPYRSKIPFTIPLPTYLPNFASLCLERSGRDVCQSELGSVNANLREPSRRYQTTRFPPDAIT